MDAVRAPWGLISPGPLGSLSTWGPFPGGPSQAEALSGFTHKDFSARELIRFGRLPHQERMGVVDKYPNSLTSLMG